MAACLGVEPHDFLLIVEGKNDRSRLRKIVPDSIPIVTTNGVPGSKKLEQIEGAARHRQVVILTDADSVGRRIRRLLKEVFPDAIDIHTKSGYDGVEHTPIEYLEERLRAKGILDDPTTRPLEGWDFDDD